jgi:hypothetical protein
MHAEDPNKWYQFSMINNNNNKSRAPRHRRKKAPIYVVSTYVIVIGSWQIHITILNYIQ